MIGQRISCSEEQPNVQTKSSQFEKHVTRKVQSRSYGSSEGILGMFSEWFLVETWNLFQWFGFYKDGDIDTILPMNETDLYLEDRIGLKKLHESGRIQLLAVDGDHLQIPRSVLVNDIIKKYFM